MPGLSESTFRDRLGVSVDDTITIAHEKYSLTPESLDDEIP